MSPGRPRSAAASHRARWRVSQVTIVHLPARLAEIMHILGWAGPPGLVLLEPGR